MMTNSASTHNCQIDSFADLMGRIQSGENNASQEVFQRFARRLVGLARRHLDRRLIHKVDPESVVQSTYRSFFVRHRAGRLQVDTWDGLWHLLTLFTLRKCASRIEFLRAERRDVRREVSGNVEASENCKQLWELAPDREPSPQEAILLAETVEALFQVSSADERPVLELSLQGYSAEEISLRLGQALRTVQRQRERIRKRLERMRQADQS